MASREVQANGGRDHPDGANGGRDHPDGPVTAPLDQLFDRGDLYTLRSAVAAHGADLGAGPDQVRHLVIIASELASNAVRHGGGRGRLRLWRVDGAVRCEVSDEGPGLPDPRGAGTTNPPALALGGRGLWIVRRLSTELTIDSTDRGTTVTAAVAVPGEPTTG
jgi:anti-sigma regulatory factor (Ser/Thr protein kinase)